MKTKLLLGILSIFSLTSMICEARLGVGRPGIGVGPVGVGRPGVGLGVGRVGARVGVNEYYNEPIYQDDESYEVYE